MARVSKKVSAAQREAENAPHRIWKTAIYARLSDFGDVLRDTESLEVQISYIKEYINHRDDLMLLDVFADKRCTGMNFDRPEFERLLKALQERKVNCIVVKDFSRLGRNFVETGQYLEQVFPLFGVRFIAINDNYDSLNSQSRDGMLVPIKSMINEMYSKDLSQKIQSCFRFKEARGEIYMPVPFGYKRNQQNHLILDEEVSDVVVRIFLWKKSGMKEREIAKKLSAQGIQTPFTRRCQLGYLKNTLRVKDPAWQTVFVTKVLENPIYTGTMVYNRIAYDEANRKIGQNPRESWRMVPDSHPAIISWELFDEISALREAEQAVKEERKKWCRQRRENNPNIFKGRIFCKKCGEKLVCHWQSEGTLYFYCASCHVSISEKDLWNGINKELHQRMEEHRDLQKLVRKSSGKSKLQSKEIATKREIEQASGNIVRLESQKRSGYEQYVLGKISKEKFLELKQDAENEIEAYRPFGFLPDPNDCHRLILDPVASRYVRLIFELALQGNRTGTIAKILNEKQIPTPAAYHVAESHVYSEQKAWDLQRSHWTSGTVYHVLKNEKYKGTYAGAKFIMPVPCKHRVLRAPLEQQVRIEDSHAAIVTPEEFEQAQKVIMLQHGKHQAGNYTKHQYPLKGKVYCGYCQKLMKYRVLKKLGPSFNCRFSATAVDSPCKRIPISEELLEHIVRNALTAQIKQAEYVLEILHERERKALICFSALERQVEKLSAEKAEIVKQCVALYEQYADGNMSKEEFIRQRDAYRVQEDERMGQIQRLRTEKNQAFQPVKRNTDHLQNVISTVEEAGDVMHLSQNVVETYIDRIEVFNNERVKIHFTFENVLADYAE